MRRRSAAFLLAPALAAGLAACSTEPSRTGPPAASPPVAAASQPPGLAPASPAPVVPPPGDAPDRTFRVGTRQYEFRRGRDRPLPVTVWYPADRTGTRPARGTFPLVLFSHGLTARPDNYSDLLSRWAKAGFVVAAPTFPFTSGGARRFNGFDIANQPADVSHVITRLLAQDDLRGTLDRDRIAAAGHSAGGITTVGLFTAKRDERLRAGIVLAGADFGQAAFAGPPAPLLFVHGRRDETVAYRAGRAAFEAVPWSRAMLSVTQGRHLSRDAEFDVVAAATTQFLRWALYGDAQARRQLAAKATRGDLATLDDQL